MKAFVLEEKKKKQNHYEALFENGKIWYSSKEAAALLGVSAQFIRESFDSQTLMGQEICSKHGARCIKLIHRDCLMVYLIETANYEAVDFLERIKKLLVRRPGSEQEEVRVWLERNSVMGAVSWSKKR